MKKNIGRAVIVGASSGIGYEVARLLIADGWTVALAARRTAPLETLKQLAPSRVYTACIDITHPKADEALLQLIESMGGTDLYFHASGIGSQNPTLQPDIELQTMHTNALGFTRMIGAAFRYFASQGKGHIAAISSIAGTRLLCHQSTAKHLHRVACTIIAHAGTSHPLYRPSSRLCAHPFIGQRRQLPHADAS